MEEEIGWHGFALPVAGEGATEGDSGQAATDEPLAAPAANPSVNPSSTLSSIATAATLGRPLNRPVGAAPQGRPPGIQPETGEPGPSGEAGGPPTTSHAESLTSTNTPATSGPNAAAAAGGDPLEATSSGSLPRAMSTNAEPSLDGAKLEAKGGTGPSTRPPGSGDGASGIPVQAPVGPFTSAGAAGVPVGQGRPIDGGEWQAIQLLDAPATATATSGSSGSATALTAGTGGLAAMLAVLSGGGNGGSTATGAGSETAGTAMAGQPVGSEPMVTLANGSTMPLTDYLTLIANDYNGGKGDSGKLSSDLALAGGAGGDTVLTMKDGSTMTLFAYVASLQGQLVYLTNGKSMFAGDYFNLLAQDYKSGDTSKLLADLAAYASGGAGVTFTDSSTNSSSTLSDEITWFDSQILTLTDGRKMLVSDYMDMLSSDIQSGNYDQYWKDLALFDPKGNNPTLTFSDGTSESVSDYVKTAVQSAAAAVQVLTEDLDTMADGIGGQAPAVAVVHDHLNSQLGNLRRVITKVALELGGADVAKPIVDNVTAAANNLLNVLAVDGVLPQGLANVGNWVHDTAVQYNTTETLNLSFFSGGGVSAPSPVTGKRPNRAS